MNIDKATLKKLRDNALYKLFVLSGMSFRDFADFWCVDFSNIRRIYNKKRREELERLADKRGEELRREGGKK